MKLTIEQALQRGVAAHKGGKLDDANRLYTAILESQPQHPDANHNMGVLAVSFGKLEQALTFFKTALEENSQIEQYWISYIDALIKLGQLDNARQVFKQVKDNGLKGEKLNELSAQLNATSTSTLPVDTSVAPSKQQMYHLVLLYNQGHLQEALAEGNALLSKFPNDPSILDTLGKTNFSLGNTDEAISNFKKSIEIKPHFPIAYYNLGTLFHMLNRPEEAITNYNKAIEYKVDFVDAYNNIGNIFNKLGHHEKAIINYNKAIEYEPNCADAYNNLDNLLNKLGKYEAAIISCKKAIELKPDFLEAHNNLGSSFFELGRYEEAIASYNKAIELHPGYMEAYSNLGVVLTYYKPGSFSEQLAKTYLDVLNLESIISPMSTVSSIITFLKHHEVVRSMINLRDQSELGRSAIKFCTQLSKIPLFTKIIELCPIPDLEIEDVLKKLRRVLLLERHIVSDNDHFLHFQSALALQCFTNEFIYEETAQETVAVEKLESIIQNSFSSKEELSSYDIACLSSYRPLHQYPWAIDIVPPLGLELLIKRQVTEVQKERDLREDIPRLNPIKNDVSIAVQDQYEENPYPRWINTKIPDMPKTIAEIVDWVDLRLVNESVHFSESPQILIAGCGTGQHSLGTSGRFKNSYVTAVDLSLNSLSYARRKTEELAITNIEYQQADILDLGMLDKQFDIVESVGVLHHMANPVAGWKVLCNCLKPGGLMRLGLYSELARQEIIKARDTISSRDISCSREDILSFRHHMIEEHDPLFSMLMNLRDFYSVSELRDLLFHVQEHRFTLLEINKILEELGLSFIGFEFTDKRVNTHFKATYPKEDDIYTLTKWHEYETLNPRLFTGMYQFWVQKHGTPD